MDFTAHCRLCAEYKPENILKIDFNKDFNIKILNKLKRFNIELNNNNTLPKNVCSTCKKSLDAAFTFITTVEQAQIKFDEFLKQNAEKYNEPGEITEIPITVKVEVLDTSDNSALDPLKIEGPFNNETENDNVAVNNSSNPENCEEAQIESHIEVNVQQKYSLRNTSNKTKKTLKRKCETVSEATSSSHKKEKTQKPKETTKNEKVTESNANKNKETANVKSENTLECTFEDNEMDFENDTDTASEAESPDQTEISGTWNDHIWKCLYCESIFVTYKQLSAHSISEHEACNPFKCFKCDRVFQKLDHLIQHIKSHRKDLKTCCLYCNKVFPTEHNVHEHYISYHFDINRYALQCTGCSKMCRTEKEIEEHKEKFLKTNDTKTTTSSSKNKKQTTICEVCNVDFKTPYSLTHHKLRKHPDLVDKKYVCELCGDAFFYSKEYKKHLSSVHKQYEKQQCPHCEKQFNFKSCLRNHLRQHTGEKPYTCYVCDRQFTNGPNCNKHMLRIHGIDNRRQWLPARLSDDDD